MPDTILFVLTSHAELGDSGRPTGFWLSEAADPWHVLTEAGYRVELASIAGGRPPIDGADLSDPVQSAFVASAVLDSTLVLSTVDPSRYAAVLYVGGHGTMWDFHGNADIARLGSSVYQSGGVIGAVCHGPVALLDLTDAVGASLVSGLQVTSFTDAEERESQTWEAIPYSLEGELRARGAVHSNGDVYAPHVVVDGRIVTGQNPSSAPGVAREMVRLLSR
ncbi:type 1 glutamine amidotransferase domain-containing protein [Lentzea sp. JNUCC 0626]|uniref:type 1 glutamine amidotransferase domain-containing protein n=1 Tax=Lentzea sp. JNUCC 0626 TaxID=3367513 RepID=UPI0037491F7C